MSADLSRLDGQARDTRGAMRGSSAGAAGVAHRPQRSVCIVQAVAKQYRVPFFDRLHGALEGSGVALRVVYSAPNRSEACRGDAVALPAAYGLEVPGWWLAGERLLLQPVWRHAAAADLVIVEQANKYLMSWPLLMASRLGLKKVAYWGHGRNLQALRGGGSEWLKRRAVTAVDWWFAYTDGAARYVERCGMPRERITMVRNSVDVSGFSADLAAVSDGRLGALRGELGLRPSDRVALFCGSLHPDKRLGFLVEVAEAVHRRLPEFRLLVVGGGPEAERMADAARRRAWLRYLGPRFGADKAACFRLAEVFLCPGLVGLGILDAWAAGLPLLTTDLPIHSPEIEYLEDGVTGLMTPYDVQAYALAVGSLLLDEGRLAGMRSTARHAARRYGLEAMVERFHSGVMACLHG